MKPTLSILICTVACNGVMDRREYLARLMARLHPQLNRRVTVKTNADDGQYTIGAKRQALLSQCETDYLAFVDDDDLVHERYVELVLDAIDRGADVVGFKLRYYEDGRLDGYATHSMQNIGWEQQMHEDGLRRFTRRPNHLNPVRREMARAIGFKSMNMGEDADYSDRLCEKFPSMNEVFVDEFLYDYLFRHKPKVEIVMYEPDGTLTRAGMEKIIKEGGSVMFQGRTCTKLEQLDMEGR